jgi:hypothetical protein
LDLTPETTRPAQAQRVVSPDYTARRNNATRATYNWEDIENPFAEGAFRFVAKATYDEGERKGEAAVCKWFKSGHVMENIFFNLDIKAMEKAVSLVGMWNQEGFIRQIIKVNVPEVWTFDESSGHCWRGRKVLVEPYIKNYKKFNSNTGWADTSTLWHLVMQAISHYSYHISEGKYLLCDLQGGLYSKSVILTDPVILSRKKMFGVTDLGPKGISSFFCRHRCNEYCRSHWRKPHDQTGYYAAQMNSSMMTGDATTMPPPPRVLRR